MTVLRKRTGHMATNDANVPKEPGSFATKVAPSKSSSLTKSNALSGSTTKTRKTRMKPSKMNWAIIVPAILFLYFPALILFNPRTFPKWIYYLTNHNSNPSSVTNPCSNIKGKGCCIDTDRLVFLRIPKTASTSMLEILRPYTPTIVDLGELEDVVSSIPITTTSSASISFQGGDVLQRQRMINNGQGYHNPATREQRYHAFYKSASYRLLYPPFTYQNMHDPRVLYQGHFPHVNFSSWIPLFYPNTTTTPAFLPSTISWIYNQILDLYSHSYPPAPFSIPQWTMLRHPFTRLRSMYEYSRTMARHETWRMDYVQVFGNDTLETCLQSPTCIQRNRISQWCNLQTELLCGIKTNPKEQTTTSSSSSSSSSLLSPCRGGNSPQALEQAKATLSSGLIHVGVMERFHDSLQYLSSVFPTYLPTVPAPPWPHRKKNNNNNIQNQQQHDPKASFSELSLETLTTLCHNDLLLYDFANQILTERLQECV